MAYPIHAVFVLVYLVALIGVGALKAGKIKSQEDFSLAGRGLPTFVLVGTLLATWIGTGSIFGNAEKTCKLGIGAYILPVAGVLGIILLSTLAARIRKMEQFTIQDILEARFGVGTRIVGTIALVLAYVIIVSYQYRAGAAVVGRLFPDLQGTAMAVIAVAGFVIAYTALAGMFSVAYTDVANGVLMTGGILVAIPILFSELGGFSGISEGLAAYPAKVGDLVNSLKDSLPPDKQGALATAQALAAKPASDFTTMTSSYSPLRLINWLLPAFLLILGDANMYQRFFSAKDPGSARRSALWLILGIAVLECAIITTALLGPALIGKGMIHVPADDDGIPVFGHIIVSIAFEGLPAVLGALLMATVIAIVVSTADSYLLAPATSVVRDVYKRFLRPDASETRVVLVGRLVVIFFGLVALALAFASKEFFDVALFAYTIYGATITPVMLAAFFWPRATRSGALWAMISGGGAALAWQALVHWDGMQGIADTLSMPMLLDIDAVLPALFLSVVVLVSVSLAGKDPRTARS